MKTLIRRIEAIELRMKPKLEEKEDKPIGIALGCTPDAFIDWYDYCLHPEKQVAYAGLSR